MGDDFEQTCQKEVDINFAVNKNATKALLWNHLSESTRETEKQIYNKTTVTLAFPQNLKPYWAFLTLVLCISRLWFSAKEGGKKTFPTIMKEAF